MNYIKKISLNSVESYLGKTLKRNTISMGVDIAMHITGIALIRTTDSYLILERIHKIEVPKDKSLLDCIDLFLAQLNDFKNKIIKDYKLDINVIEDCFFSKNVKTLKSLARFGVLIYDKFRDITKNTLFIMPTQARKLIGFKKSDKSVKGIKVKKEVINYINEALDLQIKDSDIADAIVLSLGGLI